MQLDIYKQRDQHKIAFVLCNMGIGDMLVTVGIREYLSTKYDTVIMLCREEFLPYLYRFHEGNDKIKHYVYQKSFMAKFGWSFPKEIVDEFAKLADIYALGHYSPSGKMETFPVSFYDDCCVDFKYIKSFVNIIPYDEKQLTASVKGIIIPKHIMQQYKDLFDNHKSYIVVHQEGSTCNLDFVKKCAIDINDILVIDLNKNLYTREHPWYNIAEKFINFDNPMWYKPLLENATGLCLVDSCIHALAYLIDISNVKQPICYYRASTCDYVDAGFKYIHLVEGYDINKKIHFSYPDGDKINPFWTIGTK